MIPNTTQATAIPDSAAIGLVRSTTALRSVTTTSAPTSSAPSWRVR